MTNPRETRNPETLLSESSQITTASGTQAVFRTTAGSNGAQRVHGTSPASTSAARGTLHDPLTGLANEHLLLASLHQATQRTKAAGSDSRPTLIVLQIDRIPHVATCFGPQAQKGMVETVAKRLESSTPPNGILARTGSSEFTLLIEADHPSQARLLATKIESKLRQPISLDGHLVLPAARIGISSTADNECDDAGDGQDAAQLLRHARLAAVGSTGPGYAGATTFDPRLRQEATDRMRLEAELSLAVEREELRLHYQPIMSIDSGEVSGFEALLRWEHPTRGTIRPDEIIPMAEETGLINPIGDWVLSEACNQMAAWQKTYRGARNLTLNVNLSARQLEQPDLVRRVVDAQRSSGLETGTLRLELTETMVIAHETAVERLRELRQHGIEIQLDDFGAGYSSLGYLGRLPIDSLKLDRSFVEEAQTDDRSAAILGAVVALARELKLGVTAEGIETKEQAEQIRSLACESGQGYFFHRPLIGAAVEQLLVA